MAQVTAAWSPLGTRPLAGAPVRLHSCLRGYQARGGCLVVYAEAREIRRDGFKDFRNAIARDLTNLVVTVQTSNGVQGSGQDFLATRSDINETSLTSREERLYERQEKLYEREMERWDKERQYWHQREAMLLQHISKLHTGLLALAQIQAKQLPPGEEPIALGEPGESTQRARAALVTDRDAYDATDTSLDLPASSVSTRGEYSSGESPATVERDSASGLRGRLELRQSAPASSGNGVLNPVRAGGGTSLEAQLQSAMAAVDKVDILRDEPNFLDVDYTKTDVPHGGGAPSDAQGMLGGDEGKRDTGKAPGAVYGREVEVGDDEEDELEKQMLKALEEIAQMVGESEMAVGDILESTKYDKDADDDLLASSYASSQSAASKGDSPPKKVRSFFDDDYEEPPKSSFFDDDAPGQTPARSFYRENPPPRTSAGSPPKSFFGDEPLAAQPGYRSPSGEGSTPPSSFFDEPAKPPASSTGQAAPSDGRPVVVPTLVMGADDVFWVTQLQNALDAKGYFCGDAEVEDMYFGDGTFSALITFQACNGLPETGVCNLPTWRALLGDELDKLRPPSASEAKADAPAARTPSETSSRLSAFSADPAPPPPPPARPSPPPSPTPAPAAMPTSPTPSKAATRGKRLWAALFASDEDLVEAPPAAAPPPVVTAPVAVVEAPTAVAQGWSQVQPEWTAKEQNLGKWPILREGDGGIHVHQLHCAMSRRGYSCGEDDETWWQFGDMTYSALLAFQACEQLPETGVADADTWHKLLGEEADPSIIGTLRHGDFRDDDMLGKHNEGMVFLLGEQRWARKITK